MTTPLPAAPLVTVDDVRSWFESFEGGPPHPDDSAWLTCERITALGFDDSRNGPDHSEGGHLSIVGPDFDIDKATAIAYDEAMDKAQEICSAAGVDIYALGMETWEDCGS